jgi:hypothetical protein
VACACFAVDANMTVEPRSVDASLTFGEIDGSDARPDVGEAPDGSFDADEQVEGSFGDSATDGSFGDAGLDAPEGGDG